MAAMEQAMLDGITYALDSGRSAQDLQAEMSKKPGDPAAYLQTERAYRSEDDVFEHFTQAERDRLFGTPPATVFETLGRLDDDPEGVAVLTVDGVFDARLIASYRAAMRSRWLLELSERILPANIAAVRECRRVHGEDEDGADEAAWADVHALRRELMRDTAVSRSLFSRIRDAIERGDDAEVSTLQQEMNAAMTELRRRYNAYTRNVLDPVLPEPEIVEAAARVFSAVSANVAEP
jgi:glutamine synthetase